MPAKTTRTTTAPLLGSRGAASTSASPKPQTSTACWLALLVGAVAAFLAGLALGAVLHAHGLFSGSPVHSSGSGGRASTAGARQYTSSQPGRRFVTSSTDDEPDTSDSADEEHCPSDFPWQSARLPSVFVPRDYNLTIHPNITTGHVAGSVAIDIDTVSGEGDTSLLVVHALQLNLTTFYISVDGHKVDADFFDCVALGQWAFQLSSAVKKGSKLELGIEYETTINDDLYGFYYSTHYKLDGRQIKSVATQFEPTHARRMVPCFDEPAFKARWEVSVVREAAVVVRSNMPLRVTREHVDGLYVDVFERSVVMSSYLLAVALLNDYDYAKRIAKNTKRPIEVRLYAPRDQLKGQHDFGLEVGVRALEFFEDYFNMSYPLNKLDLLALTDFAEGAMENWGLITFRDHTLLYNEKTSSIHHKHNVATIVCHELAHQWFGNLVTMRWWNDIWLNEGFANYMESVCAEKVLEDQKEMTGRFYLDTTAAAQDTDGLITARAVAAPVDAASEQSISNLFDHISYQKAASLLAMLAGLTGERAFRASLIHYLRAFSYANAEGAQLWAVFEKHARLPDGVKVNDVARAYTLQPGFPVVRASLSASADVLIVRNQTRFFFDRAQMAASNRNSSLAQANDDDGGGEDDSDEKDEEKPEKSQWPIPIRVRGTKTNVTTLHWLLPGHEKLVIPVEMAPQSRRSHRWALANSGGLGYFKVLYDPRIYAALAAQLKVDHQALSEVDRLVLLSDAFDFTRNGLLSVNQYFELIEYAENEDTDYVLLTILRQLVAFELVLEDTSYLTLLQDFSRHFIVNLYSSSGWDAKVGTLSERSRGLRAEVLRSACRLRHADCSRRALARFHQWLKDPESLEAELLDVVTSEAVGIGGREGAANWAKIYSRYIASHVPHERHVLLVAMAHTHDVKLVDQFLHMTLNRSEIKPNLVANALRALSIQPLVRAHAWRFFQIHFDDYRALLGDGSNLLTHALRSCVGFFATKYDADQVVDFMQTQGIAGQARGEQIRELLRLNVQWRELVQQRLIAWLKRWDRRRRRVD